MTWFSKHNVWLLLRNICILSRLSTRRYFICNSRTDYRSLAWMCKSLIHTRVYIQYRRYTSMYMSSSLTVRWVIWHQGTWIMLMSPLWTTVFFLVFHVISINNFDIFRINFNIEGTEQSRLLRGLLYLPSAYHHWWNSSRICSRFSCAWWFSWYFLSFW